MFQSLLILLLSLLLLCDLCSGIYNSKNIKNNIKRKNLNCLEVSPKGFGNNNINDNINDNISKSIPKPNVIVPSQGSKDKNIEKFLMMYTCKLCSGRNAHMVSKIAYTKGMVIATCRHCKSKHLIADNEGKLDMKEYGSKIEDYLRAKGEKVQKLSITSDMLEDYSLIDIDGELKIVSKSSPLQVDSNANIIEINKENE